MKKISLIIFVSLAVISLILAASSISDSPTYHILFFQKQGSLFFPFIMYYILGVITGIFIYLWYGSHDNDKKSINLDDDI